MLNHQVHQINIANCVAMCIHIIHVIIASIYCVCSICAIVRVCVHVCDIYTYVTIEYCVYINRVIEKLNGKEVVMKLVAHMNSEVRMQALLAIQKMMVQNW